MNNTPQEAARQAVDDLIAAGATFTYRPPQASLPASFVYELSGGGDRQQCRRIIAGAKGDPLVWAAVVAEVERRTGGADAAT